MDSSFDLEIRLRSIAVGAVLGVLAGWGLAPEIGAAIGGVVGAAYDWAAFRLKLWMTAREASE